MQRKLVRYLNFPPSQVAFLIVNSVWVLTIYTRGFPSWLSGKESACQCRRWGFNLWVGKIPWRRKWELTPVFLPGKFHGQRSLVGYSPWGPRIGHNWTTKQQQCIPWASLGTLTSKTCAHGFPGGSDGKRSACNAGDQGSIPGSGRSPGEGNGNPLQYSCLENLMGRGALQATIYGVAKSQTWLSDSHRHTDMTEWLTHTHLGNSSHFLFCDFILSA